MLQVTQRILSLTGDDEVKDQPRPRQKESIIAEPKGHVMRHPAKEGWTGWQDRSQWV
jgi:hypothetical protein